MERPKSEQTGPSRSWIGIYIPGAVALLAAPLPFAVGATAVGFGEVILGGLLTGGGIVTSVVSANLYRSRETARAKHEERMQELIPRAVVVRPLVNTIATSPAVSEPDPVVLRQAANLVVRLQKERARR